ncbi:MAG: sensor histidine kinase [Pseudomonadota bacterium]
MAMAHGSDSQALVEAFQLFTEVSDQLTQAYQHLQAQVARLNDELTEANLRLREQLEEKEKLSRRLDLLLNLLPGAVLVLDGAEVVQDLNQEARRIFGDSIGKGTSWRGILGQQLRSRGQGEWVLQAAPDEPERRLVISHNRLPEQGGQILLVQDVTEAQALREAMQRQQRLSAMGEMLANLAHQLRTPLAAALLYTSQLQGGDLDAALRQRFAGRVLTRLRHLEALINDMLRFVKGETDTGQSVAVSALLQDLRQLMEHWFAEKQVMLRIENGAGEERVVGAQEALAGVLGNVLHNALHFSPTGGTVTLSAQPTGAMVEFRVADQGPGIAAAVQERLFEPFFTTRAEGNGLGLAIVREAVTQLGGEVWVKSRPGAGAVFGVRLPRAGRLAALASAGKAGEVNDA